MRVKICIQKITILIICFMISFSSINMSFAALDEDNIFNSITDMLAGVFVSLGDTAIHIISSSVGEVVTVDKLIFNDVDKVSIDFWEDLGKTNNSTTSVRDIMKGVVRKWYRVFYKIAMMVYMTILIYVGILMLLNNTAEKKAGYKQHFVNWVVGLLILTLFPYVMKYIIILNDSLVQTIRSNNKVYSESGCGENLITIGYAEISDYYGEDEFVDYVGGTDSMIGLTRSIAGNKEIEGRIGLAIVYLVLIGQTIAVLVMYYKRAFMIAFLITIFPLVAITYALDKVADGKSQSFSIWFKEYVVNVIVQSFHAVVYALVCSAGIETYISTGGSNFIFMILCVWFLFEGERILRTIFNIKSSANTMSDLAASGAVAFGAFSKLSSFKKEEDKGSNSEQDKKDVANANKRINYKEDTNAKFKEEAKKEFEDNKASGESTQSYGEYQNDDMEPDGVSKPRFDLGEVADKSLIEAKKSRLSNRITRGLATAPIQAAGGVLEGTKNLANGNDLGAAIGGAAGGMKAGKVYAKPLTFTADKIEKGIYAKRMSDKIMNDDAFAKKLGIVGLSKKHGEPDSKDASKHIEESDDEYYRKMVARMARAQIMHGKNAGDIEYEKFVERKTEKDRKK